MTHQPLTSEDVLEASRTAAAMALAAQRRDLASVITLWNGAEKHNALIFALAELPAAAIEGTAALLDMTVDVETMLTNAVTRIATIEPPTPGEDQQ